MRDVDRTLQAKGLVPQQVVVLIGPFGMLSAFAVADLYILDWILLMIAHGLEHLLHRYRVLQVFCAIVDLRIAFFAQIHIAILTVLRGQVPDIAVVDAGIAFTRLRKIIVL